MTLSNAELFMKISDILEEVKDVHNKIEALHSSNGARHALCLKIKNKPVELEAIKVNLNQRKVSIPPEVQYEIKQIDTILGELRKDDPILGYAKPSPAKSALTTAPAAENIKTVPLTNYRPALERGDPASFSLRGLLVQDKSWTLFMVVGVILTMVITTIVSYGDAKLTVYVIGGILGIYMAIFIFLIPELGSYLLIVTTISNISELFTESGLPSLNQPLVVLILFCILTNQFLRTGRVNFTIHLTRVEWALGIFYTILITTVFVARDRTSAMDLINTFTRNLVILYCIIASLNTPKKWKRGIWVAIVTATILSSMGVFQMVSGNTSFTFWGLAKPSILGQYTDEGVLRYGGPIGESNVWAQTLVGVFSFAIYRLINERDMKLKYIAGVAGLIIGGAIFYTYSRGAFVTAIIILFLIALERHVDFTKMLIVVGLGAVFVAFLPQTYISRISTLVDIVNPSNEYSVSSDESILGRATVMKVGLSMFAEHPFLGVGVGNYTDQYWDYAPKLGLEAGVLSTTESSTNREPHNLYVELMAETGIFGIMFFAVFIYVLLKSLSNTRTNLWSDDSRKDRSTWIAAIIMTLLSYLISGLFLHGAFFRYFWMFIALAMAGYHIYGDTKNNTASLEEIN